MHKQNWIKKELAQVIEAGLLTGRPSLSQGGWASHREARPKSGGRASDREAGPLTGRLGL